MFPNLVYVKGNAEAALEVARKIAAERSIPLNTKGAECKNFHRFAEWMAEDVRWDNPRVFFIGVPLLPAVTSPDDDSYLSDIDSIQFYMNLGQRNVFVCHQSDKNAMYTPLFSKEDGKVWTMPWEEQGLSLEPMEPVTRAIDFDEIPVTMEPIGALLVADYEC